MAEKETRKLTRLGTHSYYVVLPPQMIRALHWKERQRLLVERRGAKVIIQKPQRDTD